MAGGTPQRRAGALRSSRKGRCFTGAHTHAWPLEKSWPFHHGGMRNLFRGMEEEFQQMRNRIGQVPAMTSRTGFAAADLQETEKQISLKLDLPGIAKKDIKVQVDKDRVLTISGQREAAAQSEGQGGTQRLERTFGSFRRQFHLPESADVAAITAKTEEGVLSINIQKLAPEARNINEIAIA